MTEREAIDEAFAESVKQLYAVLWGACVDAASDPHKESTAAMRFREALGVARRCHVAAIEALGA